MLKYRFPGDTPYAEAAAAELGLAITPAELRGLKPYNVLTSLVSQAGTGDHADPDLVGRSILREARKQLDVLRVAVLAGDKILAEADAAFAAPVEAEAITPNPEPDTGADDPPADAGSEPDAPKPRRSRKPAEG